MEPMAFRERARLHDDPNNPRRSWITRCLVTCLAIVVLVLLSFLIACLLLHHKQTPKTCWFDGSSPVSSQGGISWTWKQNCSGSVRNAGDSSLEILESGIYFVYVYVARMEDVPTKNFFTVHLVDNSERILSRLKGPNDTRAFVTMGRSYFLTKGMKLHLEINAGLSHIDKSWTYWGLFKI